MAVNQAAIGGCTAVDVDILTSRRAQPDTFEVLGICSQIKIIFDRPPFDAARRAAG